MKKAKHSRENVSLFSFFSLLSSNGEWAGQSVKWKCGELSHDHALNSGYLWSFYSSQHQFIGVLSENWSAKILAQIKENWKYS